MAFIYTQSDLQERMNAGVQGKQDILASRQNTMNSAVRRFYMENDIRSSKRKTNLVSNLFNGIFEYQCPSDLKGQSIIDIPAQAKDQRSDGEWSLIPVEEFDRENGQKTGMIAIDDYNGTKILKLCSNVDSDSITIAELDSTTSGGGTWTTFGDAETLARDDADYIKGNGSLKFNISSAGGTTAGIVNSAVNSTDISDYLGGTSAFFVWVKINSTTGLTNYVLRFGNDASNYYSKTVTAKADGTAFTTGWNLLKFDVSSLTETGSVTDTAIIYFALYMTKDITKISESDYKFDWLVLKKGVIHEVRYYSKYGWQSSGGTYKENSTLSTDLLVADTDEFDLLVEQCVIGAMEEIGFSPNEIQFRKNILKDNLQSYFSRNPSEAKIMMSTYYNY